MPRLGFVGAALAFSLVVAPSAAAQVRPAGVEGPYRNEQLSNEQTVTRWAHSVSRARIRTEPRLSGRSLGPLRLLTEDGLPEIYMVLESRMDIKGRTWMHIRLPRRPNGTTGWVLAVALGDLNTVRTSLRINRRTLRATLFRDGRPIWRARIGVGKAATPTPRGKFYIRERLRNLGGRGVYGTWAFGTSAYSILSEWPGGGVVGIHGTNQPGLIPGRPSHGCIRLTNTSINNLVRLMPLGTPVEIL